MSRPATATSRVRKAWTEMSLINRIVFLLLAVLRRREKVVRGTGTVTPASTLSTDREDAETTHSHRRLLERTLATFGHDDRDRHAQQA